MKTPPLTYTHLFLAIAAAALVAPASAGAATRWADPAGTTIGLCDTKATACRVDVALDAANAGDEVVVLPGTYDVTARPPEIERNVYLHGTGAQRPVITSDNPSFATLFLSAGAAGSTISGLEVRNTSNPVAIVDSYAGNAKFQNLVISGPGTALSLEAGSNQTIEDVTAVTHNPVTSVIAKQPGTKLRKVSTISLDADGTGLSFGGSGSSAEDVFVSSAGYGAVLTGSDGDAPVTVTRSRINAARIAVAATDGPVRLTSSFVRTTAAGATAVVTSSGADVQLLHVTAIARGPSAWAASVGPGSPNNRATLAVRNSIARGTAGSVHIDAASGNAAPGTAVIGYSNVNGFSAAVKTQQGLQGDVPKFVNAGGGDYRVKPGSATIDAGIDDPASGATDYYGNARKQGAAVDLGAYEATPGQEPTALPPGDQMPDDPSGSGNGNGGDGGGQPGGGQTGGGQTGGPGGGAADTIVPVLKGVSFTRRTFAIGARSTPVAARAKKGTTLRYALSEPGTVTVVIQRQVVRKHKRKYVGAGKLTRASAGGAGKIAFSGRLGKKKLAAGKYRAVVTAIDRAGNRSRSKALSFRIVKR